MNLHELLSSPLMQRLGWTLLHSLWQMTAVTALTAFVLVGLRRRSPQARYLTICGAMGVMVVLFAATFLAVHPSPASSAATVKGMAVSQVEMVSVPEPVLPRPAGPIEPTTPVAVTPTVQPSAPLAPPPAAAVAVAPWPERLGGWLEPYLPWLVGTWLVGMIALSVWRLGGWIAVLRLRVIGTRPLGADIQAMLRRLADRLGVRRAVSVVQSAVVATPIVTGWLRPVVLLPVSAVTGLTPLQLEAILAHELAHIRRHDYLVNLLQTLVETLLFYHPAVWWASARMRAERERCCDDMAVALCGDHIGYAEALAAVVEARMPMPAVAASSLGGRDLLDRIRRVLGVSSQGSARTTLVSAALSLALVLAMLAIPLAVTRGGAATQGSTPTTQPASGPVAHEAALSAQWQLVAKNDLASVEVEKTLYDQGPKSPCFTCIRVTNVSNRPIGVELKDEYQIIYSIGMGPLPEPRRTVNGLRKVSGPGLMLMYPPMTATEKSRLIVDFKAGRLVRLEQGQSVDYYRDCLDPNPSGTLIFLGGIMKMTDGVLATRFTCSGAERTEEYAGVVNTQVEFPPGVERAKVPAGALVFSGGKPSGTPTTQPATQPATMPQKGATLEFRIVPNATGSSQMPLVPLFVDGYGAGRDPLMVLAEHGPGVVRQQGEAFQWFAWEGASTPPGAMVGEYQGRKYILLAGEEPFVMSPGRGKDPWRLKDVYVTMDGLDQPAIGFELDDRGAEVFAAFTKANVGNALAILVDGKVVSAPIIRGTLGKRGIITGRYSRQEVMALVKALRDGMARTGQAATRAVTQPSTGPAETSAGTTVVRVYDVSDLLVVIRNTPGPDYWDQFDPKSMEHLASRPTTDTATEQKRMLDELIDSIRKTVDPESWSPESKIGKIREVNGRLVITQTPENQAVIVRLIEHLREPLGLQVRVEARVIRGSSAAAGGKGDDLLAWLEENVKSKLNETTSLLRLSDDEVGALLEHIEGKKEYATVATPRITLFNTQRANVLVGKAQPVMMSGLDNKGQKAMMLIPTGTMVEFSPVISANRRSVSCEVVLWDVKSVSEGEAPVVAVAEGKKNFQVADKGTMLIRVPMVQHKVEGARQVAGLGGAVKMEVQHKPLEKPEKAGEFVYFLIRPEIIEPQEYEGHATRPAGAPGTMPASAPAARGMGMVIRAGEGVGPVELVMSREEVIGLLGKPDKFEGRIGLNYIESLGLGVTVHPQRGVEVISCWTSKATDMLSGLGVKDFAGATDKGIKMGAGRDEIVRAYGEPDSQTGDAALFYMDYSSKGIVFMLRSGKLVKIDVVKATNPPTAATRPATESSTRPAAALEEPRFKDVVLFVNNRQYGNANGTTVEFGPSGKAICGYPKAASELEWEFQKSTPQGDIYFISRKFPADSPKASVTQRTVSYNDSAVTVFQDADQRIILMPRRFAFHTGERADNLTWTDAVAKTLSRADADSAGVVFLNIKTGEVAKAPFELKVNRAAAPGIEMTARLKQWVEQTGVDCFVIFGDRNWSMGGLEMRRQDDPKGQPRWATVAPSEVMADFAEKNGTVFVSGYWPFYMAGMYRPDASYFRFRTREGCMGVLQYAGNGQGSITIQYKMLQLKNAGGGTPATGPATRLGGR